MSTNPRIASPRAKPSSSGSAYGRPTATSLLRFAQVGPGTPCGEWMRRYWQPVLTSAHVTSRPQMVRLLGENLVVFRDKLGRVGLLYPRCMHRGTSLQYGKVEERGIRCCYHGWLFDVQGNCLEQPCEPKGGLGRSAARQPWFPVEERYGMVWAYMGPPEKQPQLPRYDIFENLDPGEHVVAEDGEFFGLTGDSGMPIANYNWLQAVDNIMDPFHVQVLHSTFSVHQFAPGFAVMPQVEFEYIPDGMIYSAYRKLDDGREVDRISCWLPPCAASIPNIGLEDGRAERIVWFYPVDDTHVRIYQVVRTSVPANECFQPLRIEGKTWSEMTEQERRDTPGDYEAQYGQGIVSLHSEEHLASSDRGVVMLRRRIDAQIKAVEEGHDPIGITFGPTDATIKIPSGNFYRS
jgi:nitrite reductase/ring-hydroxylating ferredoxin subunit